MVKNSLIATDPGKHIPQGYFNDDASVFDENIFYATLESVQINVYKSNIYGSVIKVQKFM